MFVETLIRIDQRVFTSDSSVVVETIGERRVSRNLVHSRLSFSFSKRRRFGMEKSRADMMAVVEAQ